MNFINSTVDVQKLPAVQHVQLNSINPSYKKILRIEWLITTGVLLCIVTGIMLINPLLQTLPGWALAISFVSLPASFYYILIQKSFPFIQYAVRDKDVIHQKGWLIRRIKTCPFNRIQNCSVQSGPLERKYGLASLIIFTAGYNGADMHISGLLQKEADRLRHFILSQIHTEPNEAA